VVLSNADDQVVSTSGADDRFEVVPQVFVKSDGTEYDRTDLVDAGIDMATLADEDAIQEAVSETLQSFGQNVIVDLDERSDSGSSGSPIYEDVTDDNGTVDTADDVVIQQIDRAALGDVIYLEGVDDISNVAFNRFQVGREGENSLKITTTVRSNDTSEENNEIANAGEVTVFKQFDALTDRFAVETLEISDTSGQSQYWSLSGAQADRDSTGAIQNTYVTTDVSNTGKGILVGSENVDKFKVDSSYAGTDSVEVLLTSFDSSDSIDLSAFGSGLSTQTVGDSVEVSDENGNVKLTLIGITDPVNIDDNLVLTSSSV